MVEAEVAHHGGHHGVLGQRERSFSATGTDGQDLVAVHHRAGGVDGQAPVGVAVQRDAEVGAVLEDVVAREPMWVEPTPSLMFSPSGSPATTTTSAPARRNSSPATEDAAPLAQSTTTFRPASDVGAAASRCSMYVRGPVRRAR